MKSTYIDEKSDFHNVHINSVNINIVSNNLITEPLNGFQHLLQSFQGINNFKV